MDGPGDLVARLRTALAAFDDEALAALANKGLGAEPTRTWNRPRRGSSGSTATGCGWIWATRRSRSIPRPPDRSAPARRAGPAGTSWAP